MTDMLRLGISSPQSNWMIIDCQGDVDEHNAHLLSQAILSGLERGLKHITVDLSGVKGLDDIALGTLVGGLQRCRQQDCLFDLITHHDSRSSQVLEITGLKRLFEPIHPDFPAAAAIAIPA